MDIRQYRISRIGFILKSYYIHEDDTLLYKVERIGAFFCRGYVMSTYQGDRVITVMRKNVLGNEGITISDNNNHIIGDLKHKFSFAKQKFLIHAKEGEYAVKGNIKNSEFTIYLNQEEIGKISRNKSDSKNYIGIAAIGGANQKNYFRIGYKSNIKCK